MSGKLQNNYLALSRSNLNPYESHLSISNWNMQIRSIPVNTIFDAQIYIDSKYGIQKSNYALNKSYLFDKNQRLTQLAGPWVLIKVRTAEKIMNAIKKTGASVTSVRDKKGLVGYPGMASPCSLQIAKNLSLYHMTAR